MMRIDPDGRKSSGILLVLVILTFASYFTVKVETALYVGWSFLGLLLFTAAFFRDPDRTAPGGEQDAVSAADGTVMDVSPVESPDWEDGKVLRIAVFMNVFNVHVNRSPLAGKVLRTEHHPGKKLPVLYARAEHENEYCDTDIESSMGLVRIRQIAGVIARRVVTRVQPGACVERGGRIGIIRFGSRVDVFLSSHFNPVVSKGDSVHAGSTIIAVPYE